MDVRLAAVTSPTAERREAFARESGATAYPSLAAMLAHVDVVDVCSPPRTHEAVALEASPARSARPTGSSPATTRRRSPC